MVYHNYIKISEWNDNVVLFLSTKCLRFLSTSFMISAQTGHCYVHFSRIAPREVLVLIPLLVFFKKKCVNLTGKCDVNSSPCGLTNPGRGVTLSVILEVFILF